MEASFGQVVNMLALAVMKNDKERISTLVAELNRRGGEQGDFILSIINTQRKEEFAASIASKWFQ